MPYVGLRKARRAAKTTLHAPAVVAVASASYLRIIMQSACKRASCKRAPPRRAGHGVCWPSVAARGSVLTYVRADIRLAASDCLRRARQGLSHQCCFVSVRPLLLQRPAHDGGMEKRWLGAATSTLLLRHGCPLACALRLVEALPAQATAPNRGRGRVALGDPETAPYRAHRHTQTRGEL